MNLLVKRHICLMLLFAQKLIYVSFNYELEFSFTTIFGMKKIKN